VTDIPLLVPPTRQPVTQPYLTPAQFTAYPTWLDLDNLLPGGVASVQTDILADALLAATDWCVGECSDMPLNAHYVQGEQLRTRIGSGGRVYIKPRDIPVRAVTALSYGADPSSLNALALPDNTWWNEDGREQSFRPGGGIAQFTGPAIQFGQRLRTGLQVYVNWSYIAGYSSTVFSAAVAAAAMSVTVADPTGICPGDTLRVYDEGTADPPTGASEALTVASTYTPSVPTVPPTPTVIPLAAAAQYAHAQYVGVTGMPRRLLQAVIAYTVALLMRKDVSDEEPASAFGPAARTVGDEGSTAAKAGGLVNDARGWIASFRPTFRS
jgi:hypothetical protein